MNVLPLVAEMIDLEIQALGTSRQFLRRFPQALQFDARQCPGYTDGQTFPGAKFGDVLQGLCNSIRILIGSGDQVKTIFLFENRRRQL